MAEEALNSQLTAATSERDASPFMKGSTRLTALIWGLVCLGLVMVTSASGGNAVDPESLQSAALRRGLWVCVGALAFLAGRSIDYRFWRRHNYAILAVGIIGLIAVLIPGIGSTVNGARRWIRFGSIVGVQPSEFAKIAICIWVAAYAERNARQMDTVLEGFAYPLGVIGVTSLLVLMEPDFGTSVLIGVIGTAVLVVSGTRILLVTLGGLALLPVAYQLVLGTPYRRERLMIFLNPWADPRDSGYQLIQSKIATGSGGLLGEGLGSGLQKMGFLPGARNDFIFAIIAEELGFVGGAIVILLFLWLLWEGFRVAMKATERFGFALAFGITFFIALQAAFNVAVVTGSVPPKGLSLPFVSAGGSSLFFTLFAAGILVKIAATAEKPPATETKAWYRDVPEYQHAAERAARWAGGVIAGVASSLRHEVKRWLK